MNDDSLSSYFNNLNKQRAIIFWQSWGMEASLHTESCSLQKSPKKVKPNMTFALERERTFQ